MKPKKDPPDISISLNGYDCSSQFELTADDLQLVSTMFVDAATALRKKQHGAFECRTLLNIGLDFGGPFDERDGLPVLKLYRRKR